jgi:hypothetical protein
MDLNSNKIYEISQEKEANLFQNALFVFDSSSLLGFYYYSEKTRDQIFENVFKSLKSRLWITEQIEFEFLKNREKVKQKPVEVYKNLITKSDNFKDGGHIDDIEKLIKEINEITYKKINGHYQTLKEKTKTKDDHPFFDKHIFTEFDKNLQLLGKYLNGFNKNFNLFKKKIKSAADTQIKSLKDLAIKDNLAEQFKNHFQTYSGFSFHEIMKIIELGEIRYRNSIPPGYLDKEEKIGQQRYGDLIIWKQIIELAKEKQKPVVLIINDSKEDWWVHEANRKTKSPRYELIKEIYDEANVEFWMYSTKDFLFKSNEFIDSKLANDVLEEVKKRSKTRISITMPEWITTQNNNTPQKATWREIDLKGGKFKNIKLTLKIKSEFMRFGFKLLAKDAEILSKNSVLTYDRNLLIHIGKQIDNESIAFASFKNGTKDKPNKIITELKNDNLVVLELTMIDNNNIEFSVNNDLIYSTFIEESLRERFCMIAWGDFEKL